MARETLQITQTTVNAALRVADNSKVEKEYGDILVRGLCLRVRRRTVSWALRCRLNDKQAVFSLGPVAVMRDLDRVRQIAAKGKSMAAAGEDPREFFKASQVAETVSEAEAIQRRRAGQEWTWEELVERYLDWCKKNVAEGSLRPATLRSYTSALRHRTTSPLHGKLLSLVTREDVQRVRKGLERLGKARQWESTMQQVKSAFAWAVDEPDSGLKINPAADVKTKPRARGMNREDALRDLAEVGSSRLTTGRALSLEELRVLLLEADRLEQPRHALMLVLEAFTAQRRLTVASAIKHAFRPDETYGMLWVVHPGSLKRNKNGKVVIRRRPHVLPLPEAARVAVETAMKISRPDSPWLFPQLRVRRAGDSGDNHISEKSLNEVMRRLQLPEAPLHSDRSFSPHSLRHSFSTYTSKLNFKKDMRKLVLDHQEDRGDDVEEVHYNQDQMLPDKWRILSAWEDLLVNLKGGIFPAFETALAA